MRKFRFKWLENKAVIIEAETLEGAFKEFFDHHAKRLGAIFEFREYGSKDRAYRFMATVPTLCALNRMDRRTGLKALKKYQVTKTMLNEQIEQTRSFLTKEVAV